jgi:hypothetical protein
MKRSSSLQFGWIVKVDTSRKVGGFRAFSFPLRMVVEGSSSLKVSGVRPFLVCLKRFREYISIVMILGI